MSQCPFLSTPLEKVKCFSDCAFYNLGEADEMCPFKSLTVHKSYGTKNMLDYDMYDENKNTFYEVSNEEDYI